MTCKDCQTVCASLVRRRCPACVRALWRRQKAASDLRLRRHDRTRRHALGPVRAYYRDHPDLSPEAIEAAYQAALQSIRAERRGLDVSWKSQAALMVEAA